MSRSARKGGGVTAHVVGVLEVDAPRNVQRDVLPPPPPHQLPAAVPVQRRPQVAPRHELRAPAPYPRPSHHRCSRRPLRSAFMRAMPPDHLVTNM